MELSKNFEPGEIEIKWTEKWKENGYFKSIPDNRPPFTVVIPPPNVTGVLHMGHTLNETVQDILVRKARMSGFNACWVPGSDHASIATEAKVVAMLKEKGIDKNDLSREEFLKYAFEWKEKYGNIIYSQIEKLGCSVDWSRVTFTMDKHYYDAVIKVFVDLYEKDLIYRGARMINWDVAAKTALSDEEVEYKDVNGKLYYIKYMIENPQAGDAEYITVATQRPETIMGDTAVCVNPADSRYSSLKGKNVIVPLINKPVPVIFDDYVDPTFGTGALKVTPAHDINDYNLGLKYNLEVIDTLNEDGTLSEAATIFVGTERFKARREIVKRLEEENLLLKEESYSTRLGYSQRTGVVVEPRISTQWFVKMSGLAKPALDEVVSGNIKIHPGDKFLATYKYWLENVKDWCISRQLWWGQQIPAWYDEAGNMVVANDLEEAKKKYFEKFGKNSLLTQDEDVLDTWFSSWLWPMEVFKGISSPGNNEEKYYYPSSVLVTGQDIIFFWVARMIMAGMEYKHEKPFSDVYFTGMVRDKQGRKMSKSLGNSPDLLELINKYGADAVRFGIMISSPAGNDLLFDEASLEQGRNFNNKMWNALKLINLWKEKQSDKTDLSQHEFATKWFESRLQEVRGEVDILMQQFRLSEALKKVYSLIWDDFCSWFLEWIKPALDEKMQPALLQKVEEYFSSLLQILHPFMPFITEEINSHISKNNTPLCVMQFPENKNPESEILNSGETLKQLITAVRDVRNKQQLKPKEQIEIFIEEKDSSFYKVFSDILIKQVNASSFKIINENTTGCVDVVAGKNHLYINTGKDINTESSAASLTAELDHLRNFLQSVNRKLENEKFMQNAKPEVVALEQKKRSDATARIAVIENLLKN
ncbi:MAG: valine--tRNA ligase [Bacteroidetes bacterium]|nr:valine--tRNA ligase [Bacteroidota bacterium]